MAEKGIQKLSASNFTYMKKVFHHPPEEYVRYAGKFTVKSKYGEWYLPLGGMFVLMIGDEININHL